MADVILGKEADRLLAQRVIAFVAVSYVTSMLLLLLGFACIGTIGLVLPIAYGGCGLLECAFFWYLTDQPSKVGEGNDHLIPQRLVISATMQLVFMALAPQIAFYFLAMLFVVYGVWDPSASPRGRQRTPGCWWPLQPWFWCCVIPPVAFRMQPLPSARWCG
jgi:hypothetical protein